MKKYIYSAFCLMSFVFSQKTIEGLPMSFSNQLTEEYQDSTPLLGRAFEGVRRHGQEHAECRQRRIVVHGHQRG